MKHGWAIGWLLLCCWCWVVACSPPANDVSPERSNDAKDENAVANPAPEAYYRPGPVDDERTVLPNGRMIWPAGLGAIVDRFPVDLAVSPDGETIVVSSAGIDRVRLVDAATMTPFQSLDVGQLFSGAVWNAAGDRFWIGGGGSHVVFEYTFEAGVAAEARQIPVLNYPSGLALSPDESELYVACLHGKRLAVVDLLDGEEVDSIPTHLYSLDVKISSDGDFAFVSSIGRGLVSVVNLQTRSLVADIEVGDNPEGLAISADDQALYIANSDADSISVVDIDAQEVTATWPIYTEATTNLGASPVAVVADRAGERVYVGCSGTNEITVFNTANGQVLGRIPGGWYVTQLRLDEDRGYLYYTSGKGYGSYGLGLHANWRSTVHQVAIPNSTELAEFTDRQDQALNWSASFYQTDDLDSPIPTQWGQPSQQIKHVVFILKENKTYDQIFGDLEGTERDPSKLNFGWDVTPNHHTLAQTFSVCDNLFVEGDTSVLGHLWGTFGLLNDHAEKRFFTGDDYPLPDIDPTTRPPNGTIFKRLLDAGIEFRSYGQVIGFMEDFDRYAPYIDLKYGFWNMGVDDVVKADEIIREWEAGIFPPFIYISLPNDHNYGSSSGAPTPNYLLGDNDAALGKLVDWLSHSEHWADTAVFVTEDDPQSGADHIDPHRTIGLVISSWAKRGHVSSVLYSMSSIWHTIELILGLPQPGSKYTKYAAPMYDCFNTEADLTPYTGLPNPIPYEENPKGLPFQDYCDAANFDVPDQVSRMGEVLWALTRPGEPFPYDQSLSGEGEEEEEDVKEYLEGVERARAYAKAKGLEFDALRRRK